MIRRILAGAAIAGIAFGFSATAASADDTPYNSGNSVLSQFSALHNATVLNGVLNDSVKDIDVLNVGKLEEANVMVLNNG
ncbi:hypothetical protein GCM10010149_57730 [Nonomuraea roseoviolacea subsp. roseoviolacea]|uniref:Uncharacterized protein n=1 Tax=Nonomuraea rhodomycinica TaxID=1712872 RepID=A0A7Y6IVC0_9ACTN|nr:hypothetical protein [Nonomuraea rhodomycinica]NUW43764.1 hypothetical protein [Nonomuraea rhodomycinica]